MQANCIEIMANTLDKPYKTRYFNIQLFAKMRKGNYMNKQDLDILLSLSSGVYNSQRALAEKTGYSLGLINRLVKNLAESGYLDEKMSLTELSRNKLSAGCPRNAIILAAGFGRRMVPINMETPKALLEDRP